MTPHCESHIEKNGDWIGDDCQPLARLEPDATYRPACRCGWAADFTRTNRAEAIAVAYWRHDNIEGAAA